MVVIKTLLPFLATVDEKKIMCFYEPEENELHTTSEITENDKIVILNTIKNEIQRAQDLVQVVDVSETEKIPEQFDKMKDEYDSGKYEFPDIKL